MTHHNIISKYVTDTLISENIIPEEDKFVYQYCINGFLEYLFFSTTIILLSVILHCFISGILFIVMLFLIKSFTGGIHAPNAGICYVSSMAIFITLNHISLKSGYYFSSPFIYILLYVISCIVKPVSCPNKPLSEIKKKKCLIIYSITSSLFFIVLLFFSFSNNIYCSSFINLTYTGIVFLQIIGKIKYNL